MDPLTPAPVSPPSQVSPLHVTQPSNRSVSNHPDGILLRFDRYPQRHRLSRFRCRAFGLRHPVGGSPARPGRIEFLAYGPVVHLM